MDFRLTEEQKIFRESVAKFVDREIAPRAEELDIKGEIPRELIKRFGELGYLGLRYPEKYGGSNCGTITYCLFIEEVARASLSVAACVAMQSLMGTYFIHNFASEEQKQRCLVPAIKGEKIGGFALTEPNAGSDLSAISTTAKREGNYYVLNGTKTWITNGPIGDFFTVAAMTDKTKGTEGLDLFLVERGMQGFSVGRSIDKLGTRATAISELIFENCMVPMENLLGEEGQGMKKIRQVLNEVRIMTGALALGLARAAYDEAVKYANQRVQFGRPIIKFQAISFKLADMATEMEAARLMVYYAAWLNEQRLPHTKEAAMAKLYSSEMANRICDEACRIHASYGFAMDYPVQRYFRDARFLLNGGGTSEILRTIIGTEIR